MQSLRYPDLPLLLLSAAQCRYGDTRDCLQSQQEAINTPMNYGYPWRESSPPLLLLISIFYVGITYTKGLGLVFPMVYDNSDMLRLVRGYSR